MGYNHAAASNLPWVSRGTPKEVGRRGSGSSRRCLASRTILLRRPTGVTLRHLGSQWDRVPSRQECVHSLPLLRSFALHEKSSPHRPFPARPANSPSRGEIDRRLPYLGLPPPLTWLPNLINSQIAPLPPALIASTDRATRNSRTPSFPPQPLSLSLSLSLSSLSEVLVNHYRGSFSLHSAELLHSDSHA
jgi:hypothetical protein